MENIEKTKTIINKMFDLEYNDGLEGEQLTIAILHQYFEKLRKQNKMDPQSQYFSDIKNGERCVKKWRDLNNKQTPATFEKYLLLASIFSCDFRDIVYLEYDEEERDKGAFEFRFSFEQADDDESFINVDLPCIRDRMYRGVERFGFLKSDIETLSIRRKIKFDGKTILDRALGFIRKNQLESTANELINKLYSVIFSWKTRRAPVSLGLLIMFEQIMGIDILELYNPEYLSFRLDLRSLKDYFPQSRKNSLHYFKAPNIVKEKVRYFLEENQLNIHCVKKSTVIVRQNDKYGIIIANEDTFRYLPPIYQYIASSGDKFYAVENNNVFFVDVESWSSAEIIENSTVSKSVARQNIEQNIVYAVSAIINKGYRYFEIDGGIIIMSPNDKATIAHLEEHTKCRKTIKSFEKGRIYYGLIVNENFIIPPIYEQKITEGEDIYTVWKNGKAQFLNEIGIALPFQEYDDASIFSEGLCVVGKWGKYGYIDIHGEEVIPLQFDYATDFSEGLACVTLGEKDGYINTRGELVIPATYNNGYKFNQGLSVVEKQGKYGYINKKGEQVLPFIYDNAATFTDGKAAVISCGKLITKAITKDKVIGI